MLPIPELGLVFSLGKFKYMSEIRDAKKRSEPKVSYLVYSYNRVFPVFQNAKTPRDYNQVKDSCFLPETGAHLIEGDFILSRKLPDRLAPEAKTN